MTMPFKEALAARCRLDDAVSAQAGAVNTVLLGPTLCGSNTDGPAVVERIRRHLDPHGAKVAILGSGGTARASAVALGEAGADVLLLGRTPERVAAAARATGASGGSLDDLSDVAWDVLVQATPLGADGTRFLDPMRLTRPPRPRRGVRTAHDRARARCAVARPGDDRRSSSSWPRRGRCSSHA